MKTIKKIVLTGGPCAGKSTAMSWIEERAAQLGFDVLIVAETATELITGGISPWTVSVPFEFQKSLAELQLAKEKVYAEAAEKMKGDKILIVCDRGFLDNKAYMTNDEFTSLVKSIGRSEVGLRDGYDAVFHLVTAANGAEEFYTLSNNTARTETVEQACEIDRRLIDCWTGHPHLRIIDNATDFNEKMQRLMREIISFLGEPEPLEIERKFLIEYPDIAMLSAMPNCTKVEIIQTYLKSPDPGAEVRVRCRGEDGHYVYIKTTKRRVTDVTRIETEERLSRDDYVRALMDADTSLKPIRKDRYYFVYNNISFSVDVYPFWSDRAIIEAELGSEDDKIDFPAFIKVIREVTSDESYKNYSLAAAGEPPRAPASRRGRNSNTL